MFEVQFSSEFGSSGDMTDDSAEISDESLSMFEEEWGKSGQTRKAEIKKADFLAGEGACVASF